MSGFRRRRLYVHVGGEPPPALPLLLRELARSMDLAGDLSQRRAEDPILWCDASEPQPGSPLALWLLPGQIPTPLLLRSARVLLRGEAVTEPADRSLLQLRVTGESRFPESRPVLAAQRRRLRRARRLPAELLVRVDAFGCWIVDGIDDDVPKLRPVPTHLIATALAICSAATVVGPHVVAGLGWATPMVTDPASAAQAGAVDDEHVVVEPDPRRRHIRAAALARDEATAARLGRHGREHFEQWWDLGQQAALMASALGLPLSPLGTGHNHSDRLLELGTSMDSPVTARIEHLISPLPRTESTP